MTDPITLIIIALLGVLLGISHLERGKLEDENLALLLHLRDNYAELNSLLDLLEQKGDKNDT